MPDNPHMSLSASPKLSLEPTNPLRVLITGANGFVGRHLIAHLLRQPEAGGSDSAGNGRESTDAGAGAAEPPSRKVQILAAVHVDDVARLQQEPETPFNAAGWVGGTLGGQIEIVGMELAHAQSLTRMVEQARPQQIYHLAARASGADADREAVFAANVVGTQTLLEAASQARPVPRVLLASTGYVYGNREPGKAAQETDAVGPLGQFGAYTDSKIEMETIARAYRDLTVIARAFAHTGPGQTPAFAVPAFARQIARIERGLEPPQLHVGNLDAWRDLLDVRDVVRAYARLMASAPSGEIVNVALGQPVQMRSVVERLCALSTANLEIVVDPARLRPLDIACSTGDPSRLQSLTGWQPRYTLEATLSDLLDYWRGEMSIER